jgi:aspartate racemase
MKRMGVLGGISAQATMDFEARVHDVSQRLIGQDWNRSYPPMVVYYHRGLPIRLGSDGRPLMPLELDPELLEAAARLGKLSDFVVVPCNSAHAGLPALVTATCCPVLSMVELAIEAVLRRRPRRAGVLGFGAAPAFYLHPLRQAGIDCQTIDHASQSRLDAAIRAVMEGRAGKDERQAAVAALATLRAAGAEVILLGCTEIPLLVAQDDDGHDLINPAALLAEAAVRLSAGLAPESPAVIR